MNLNTYVWILGMAIFSALVNMPKSIALSAEDAYTAQWGETMVFEELSTENSKIPAYQIEGAVSESTTKMTAAEYAEQQSRKAESRYPASVNPKIRELIYLLQVRKFIKTIVPLPLPF